MKAGTRTLWTFVITSIALFMVVLDNLVVSTALPVIRVDLGATIEELEWTVNAYTLTFAVFVLTGAALGDRFGRKRMFMIGVGIFTAASAAAALAPSADWLIAARSVQGFGAAIVTPLTLTILSAAVAREKRGLALGAWSGIAGLAVAMGPLVGGAVVDGISWQWIFWLNVPVGIVLLPLASLLRESTGPDKALDIPGLALASGGLLGIVWGLIHGNGDGWTSPSIVAALAVGAALLAAFVAWERRTPQPMLPMRFFRNRAFAAANGASLLMYFGMFGSIFLLSQFFQTAQGYSPLGAGLRILPWTLMPMFVAPIAGALSDRIGGRPLMATGLALQAVGLAWIAAVSSATAGYRVVRRAVHPLRHRDGAVLRAGRQRRPVGRAAAGRGQGLRGEQLDPRGRWRSRRRRPGVDLRALRRVRVARDVQRRARPCALGRCGRSRCGLARLAPDSAKEACRAGLRARARARPATRSSLGPSNEEGGDVREALDSDRHRSQRPASVADDRSVDRHLRSRDRGDRDRSSATA